MSKYLKTLKFCFPKLFFFKATHMTEKKSAPIEYVLKWYENRANLKKKDIP